MPAVSCMTEVRADHFQLFDLRKAGQQFILDAIGKVSVLFSPLGFKHAVFSEPACKTGVAQRSASQ